MFFKKRFFAARQNYLFCQSYNVFPHETALAPPDWRRLRPMRIRWRRTWPRPWPWRPRSSPAWGRAGSPWRSPSGCSSSCCCYCYYSSLREPSRRHIHYRIRISMRGNGVESRHIQQINLRSGQYNLAREYKKMLEKLHCQNFLEPIQIWNHILNLNYCITVPLF